MSGTVRVKAIRVGRMPGIRPPGFELGDLSPGVNILHGPNGSGKTSVGRATVLALFGGSDSLWKRLAPGPEAEVTRDRRNLHVDADFTAHGEDGAARTWQVRIDAGSVETEIDGHPDTLSVGSPELAQRYRMGLAELLVESNDEFAREILRQAAGGIDLAGIVQGLGWNARVPQPRDSKDSDLRRARKELQDAEAAQANLDKSTAEIATLRKEATELRGKQADGRLIRAAIECLKAGDEARDLERRMDGIPETARRIATDADRKAKDLDERLQRAVREREDAGRTLNEHRGMPAGLDADEIHARDVDLSTARARVDELRQAETALTAAETALAAKVSQLRSADSALAAGAIAEREVTDRVDADAARDADAIAELVRAARERSRQCEELKTQFESSAWVRGINEQGLPGQDALRRGLVALTEWCKAVDPAPATGSPGTGAGSPQPAWAWPAIIVLATASLVLVAFGHVAAAIGIAAAVLAAWLAWRGGTTGTPVPPPVSELPGIQAKFERLARDLGLAMPGAWTTEAVGARIEELMDRLAERIRLDAATPIRAKLGELEAHARSAEENALAKCREFENRHRIALAKDGRLPGEGWMPLMVRAIATWRDAMHGMRSAEEALRHAEERVTVGRRELEEEFRGVGLAKAVGSQRVTAALGEQLLNGLEKRREAFAQAARKAENLEAQLDRSEESRRDAETDMRRFWDDLGLQTGDFAGLQRQMELNKQFRSLDNQLGVVQAREMDRRREVGARLDLLERGRDELERELQSLEGIDSRLKWIDEREGDIKGQVERATLGHDVSGKQLNLRRANEELLQRERNWAAAQVRGQVVAWAHESMQQGVVTPVVKEARRLLTDFSRGELDFVVHAGEAGKPPRLLARSTSGPEWRTVERLSSGERIQLLMAIRLAFLEESEERKLPIFLDEVLGSSDDERARRIIDAVIAIARTGRQVFYATAQADEVAKWQSRLKDGEIEFRIVDVAEARNLARLADFPPAEPPPEPKPLPSPEGRSHAEYGKTLGVPGVDWSEPDLGSLHPWHVLEDPDLLHEVLRQGLSTLAQVERVAAFERSGPLALARESMRAAACAYRAAGEAWRVGRGKPLTRAAIEEAEGVSKDFRERIWAVAQTVGWDSRLFMQRMAEDPPKGWRRDRTPVLEQWLRSEGHLLDEDPLDPDEIMNRVLEQLARRELRTSTSPETLRRLRGLLGVHPPR